MRSKIKLCLKRLLILWIFICSHAFKDAPVFAEIKRGNEGTIIADSVKVKKSILAFLRWYKTNLHKANSFSLLTKDKKGYYLVDKKACTDYLNFLKTSKLVSAKYTGYWQTYFDDKAVMLKKEKIKPGIPEGFDFDFILITQEPELILNKIDSLQFNTVSINKSVALIGVRLPSDSSIEYEFEMYKTVDGWQIGYISTPNYD